MRLLSFRDATGPGVAIAGADGALFGLHAGDPGFPGAMEHLVGLAPEALAAAAAALKAGKALDPATLTLLPPLSRPGKIICVGLNYADHTAESGFVQPAYPTLFARFASSLIGAGAPVARPQVSEQLDFEGELVAVIGKGGRNIARQDALSHVFGYSIFNDVSVRDYQFKSPQWTMGKNFDGTGVFGPAIVTADELPPGCAGLTLETRLNGTVVQHASIDTMVFDVAALIAIVSEGITLEPGDLFVTGTPSGVGAARKPPLWMKPGDICEVEITGLGTLTSPIVAEPAAMRVAEDA